MKNDLELNLANSRGVKRVDPRPYGPSRDGVKFFWTSTGRPTRTTVHILCPNSLR